MPYLVIPQYAKRAWRVVMVLVALLWVSEWLTNWNRLSDSFAANGEPVTSWPHQYPPAWSTAVLAAWLALGVAVMARNSRNDAIRRATPGSVPPGIPKPGLKGYDWLARNHLGAVDMARYTDTQWAQTGLPYCRNHMKGPQDARFRVVQDGYGNEYAVDPCGCGQIVNLGRLALGARAEQREAYTTAAIAGGIGLLAGATDHRSAEDFAIGYGAAAVAGNAMRQRSYRQLHALLAAHPELQGVWVPQCRLHWAPVPLPLRPPVYPAAPPPPGWAPGWPQHPGGWRPA